MSAPFVLELPASVAAGAVLAGRVSFITPPDPSGPRSVRLICEARVYGSGSEERVTLPPIDLLPPIATPNQVPFEVPIPRAGPITYAGRYVMIDWSVRAQLWPERPGDPKVSAAFTVVPRGALA